MVFVSLYTGKVFRRLESNIPECTQYGVRVEITTTLQI
jgi:hypothetical protein